MSQHPLTSQYLTVRHPSSPPPHFHSSRLPAPFALLLDNCLPISLSLSPPRERLLPSWLTSLWLFDDAEGNVISALFGFSPALCPWLCSQTIEAVNKTKMIFFSLCKAADRRSLLSLAGLKRYVSMIAYKQLRSTKMSAFINMCFTDHSVFLLGWLLL